MKTSLFCGKASGFMLTLAAAVPLVLAAGCSGGDTGQSRGGGAGQTAPGQEAAQPAANGDEDADIKAVRSQLSPEDRALVEAQEFCAVSTDERLGSMGPPLKVMVKGQPVFLCCKGCRKKALADPDRTLATAEGLKAKVKAGPTRK